MIGDAIMKIYKTGEAAKVLAVTPQTLQYWDRKGILKAHRTQTNRRYYTQEQLDNWLNKDPDESKQISVAYARVSTPKQKGNLKNQLSFIRNYTNAKGIILGKEITDIGSGLNYNRPNWNKLLKDVDKGKVGRIYVTYKDRFIRFGFDWFNSFCKDHGCEIVVLNNPDTSPEEEVTQDLLSIIHVFSYRVYGLRKYKKDMTKIITNQKDD